MVGDMNSKSYRDIVLEYIEKLGEIDKAADQRIGEDKLIKLKKEANVLKEQIDKYKLKKK
jgi:hypothetical protein